MCCRRRSLAGSRHAWPRGPGALPRPTTLLLASEASTHAHPALGTGPWGLSGNTRTPQTVELTPRPRVRSAEPLSSWRDLADAGGPPGPFNPRGAYAQARLPAARACSELASEGPRTLGWKLELGTSPARRRIPWPWRSRPGLVIQMMRACSGIERGLSSEGTPGSAANFGPQCAQPASEGWDSA